MGRRQHESLETDVLIARKNEQISNLDARLDQIINHLSLVRARLLSTLDQLDALQHEHTAAMAVAARENQRLEAKLRVAEETAREGETDRMDMRHAVEMLVKKEPSLLFSTHLPPHSPSKSKSKSSRNRHLASHTFPLEEPLLQDDRNRDHAALTEQLAYATTLISHFRVERDATLARLEHSETLVLELEASLARRDAELEGCMCATTARTTTATRSLVPGRTPTWNEGHTVLASRRKPRDDSDPFEADSDVDGTMSDILDVSMERNRELEREVELLSRRLNHARTAQDPFAPTPPHHPHEGDASLLSSLSFSPPSTATSGAAGMATPRQHQYTSRPSAIYNNDYDHEYAEARSFSTYEDEAEDQDESVTQPVGDGLVEAIHRSGHDFNHEDNYGRDPIYNSDPQTYSILKSVAVPIPSLHALHRQITLLGEKIDAFATERRRAAEASLDARTGVAGHLQTERGDGHAWETQGIPVTVGGGRYHEKSDRIQDEEDGGEDVGNGRNPDIREGTHSEVAARHVQRSPNGDSIPHYHNIHAGAAHEDDADGPYMRAAPPSPLPLPLSFPMPLPPPPTHPALPLSPPPPSQRDESGYDHPHETCEATLLAARKRETDLVARVRVLEDALSVVEAQLRQRSEKDTEMRDGWGNGTGIDGNGGGVSGRRVSAVQENGAEAWWRDVAVQTLESPPPSQSPLAIPAPVGDLLGFDVQDLHAVEEETGARYVDNLEGEDRQKDVEFGEMPMELATPLLPISAMSIVQDDDDDGDSNVECDASAHDHGWDETASMRGLLSEAGSSVEEELDSEHGADAPASTPEVLLSPRLEEEPAARSPNLRPERGNAESSLDLLPRLSVSAALSPPQTRPGTPSPLSSTGTSPTLAVGLLPSLLPHAHLSLPLPLLQHSYHASSFPAPLLPLPHPHSALRRAHTDSYIGTDCHSQQAGSAQRFVLYRATSSFVAELRQVEAESQLAESAAQVDEHSAMERDEELVAPVMLDADAGMEEERRDSDEHPPAAPS